jgi:hypothetical protein
LSGWHCWSSHYRGQTPALISCCVEQLLRSKIYSAKAHARSIAASDLSDGSSHSAFWVLTTVFHPLHRIDTVVHARSIPMRRADDRQIAWHPSTSGGSRSAAPLWLLPLILSRFKAQQPVIDNVPRIAAVSCAAGRYILRFTGNHRKAKHITDAENSITEYFSLEISRFNLQHRPHLKLGRRLCWLVTRQIGFSSSSAKKMFQSIYIWAVAYTDHVLWLNLTCLCTI